MEPGKNRSKDHLTIVNKSTVPLGNSKYKKLMNKKGSEILFFWHYNSSGMLKQCHLKTRSHFQKALFHTEIKGVTMCLQTGTENNSPITCRFWHFFPQNQDTIAVNWLVWSRRNNHVVQTYTWEQTSKAYSGLNFLTELQG